MWMGRERERIWKKWIGEGKNVTKIYRKLKIVLNNKNEYKNTKNRSTQVSKKQENTKNLFRN